MPHKLRDLAPFFARLLGECASEEAPLRVLIDSLDQANRGPLAFSSISPPFFCEEAPLRVLIDSMDQANRGPLTFLFL